MAHWPGLRPRASAIALGALVFLGGPGYARAQSTSPPTRAPERVDEGRRLFEGRAPFRNGGPPCAACHAIATVAFPNGGTVGPDLTGISDTLGTEGMQATLQTLFFPTMLPLYQDRPLTAAEQQALTAFLAQAAGASGRDRATAVLAALAIAGFLVLAAVTWLAGRNRLRGVRAPLVAPSHPGGARP